jgi:hypothetical protein
MSKFVSSSIAFPKPNYIKAGNPLREIPLFLKKFYRTVVSLFRFLLFSVEGDRNSLFRAKILN